MLSKGFAALARVHAGTWSSGAEDFAAIARELPESEVRLSGASGRRLELQVDSDDMPAAYPRQGSILEHAGAAYTVVSVADDPIRGITIILVSV